MTIAWGSAGPWPLPQEGRASQMIAEAVATVLEDYARIFPDVVTWTRRMRELDARFASDFAALMQCDLVAILDALATLVENPALWWSHSPGVHWPYRLVKRWGTKRVIFPETA